MPTYIVEREIAGAGTLSAGELQALSQRSCRVVEDLGSKIQWLQSFVTGDKIYCMYIAPDEAVVRQHSELAGFPTSRVSQITSVLDPKSAE